MASPFETVATAVITAFNTEFTAEGFVMIPDNLHESLGRTSVDVGIAPIADAPKSSDRYVQEIWAEVKFYDLWTDEISPDTQVSPYRITGFAERFRDCLRALQVSTPGTGSVWYFDVDRIEYPNDPTGNKTRFVARIRAYGNNSNLIETVA